MKPGEKSQPGSNESLKSNYLPGKELIKKNGYYYIHLDTIDNIGGFDHFLHLLNSYQLRIISRSTILNLFKIIKNDRKYN